MAAAKGPFPGFAKNREPMLRVMRMHRDAAYAIDRDACARTPISTAPPARTGTTPFGSASEHGYRNAQATVLAPTGTIGLLMDCDTTGIEPDFALVKFKKLAGGGYFKIVNQTVPRALRAPRLRASARCRRSSRTSRGTNTLLAAPHINRRTLKEKGLTDAELAKVEAAIPGVFDLDSAFARVGPRRGRLRAPRRDARSSRSAKGFSLLEHLGFTASADRRSERRHHRAHDDRGRAAPARRALRGVRLREPLRQDAASATSRRWRTCG